MPVCSCGMAEKKASKAASPPADAPMPTMGKSGPPLAACDALFAVDRGWGLVGRVGAGGRAPLVSFGVTRSPRDDGAVALPLACELSVAALRSALREAGCGLSFLPKGSPIALSGTP